MGKKNVSSREYKMLLRGSNFAGDEHKLMKSAGEFWHDLAPLLAKFDIDSEGELHSVKKQVIRVFDTADFRLRHHSYILRSRVNLETGDNELALKFRHPDRYIAQEHATTAGAHDLKKKFEEDVAASFLKRPPFFTYYTFSATKELPFDKVPTHIGKLSEHFPELRAGLDKGDKDEALLLVADFAALEVVISGATLQLSTSPALTAQGALVVWYEYSQNFDGKEDNRPVLAEFSFRYGNEQEAYPLEATQSALALFKDLQNSDWARGKPGDKTDFFYALAKSNSAEHKHDAEHNKLRRRIRSVILAR